MNTTYMVCKSKHECNIIWLHRVLQRSAVECYDTLRPNVFQPEECKGVRGRGSDDGRWTWGMWSGGRVCSAEHVCNTYIHTHVCTCSETHSTTTLQETSAQSWVKHANYVQVTRIRHEGSDLLTAHTITEALLTLRTAVKIYWRHAMEMCKQLFLQLIL